MIGTNILSKENRFACLLCGADFLPPTKEIAATDAPPHEAAIAAYQKHRETCNATTHPVEAEAIKSAAFDEMEKYMPGWKRPEKKVRLR